MIQKQLKFIIIGLAAVIALVALIFLVLNPLLIKWGIVEPKEEVELLEGEIMGGNGRILMVEQYVRKDIASIEVSNKNGYYKMINDAEINFIYIEGAEFVSLDENAKSRIFTDAGYLLTKARVAAEGIEDGDEVLADLKPFGLDPSQDPPWFRVTGRDGFVYKVIVGDKIPTTGGYYVMLDGRNAIYVLDTTLEIGILGNKYELMNPLISTPIGQNDFFFADNFKIYDNAGGEGLELFLHIAQDEIPEDSNALVRHIMLAPAPYEVSITNYTQALQTFVAFVGDAVVDIDITEESLTQYGFDCPAYRVTFTYNDKDYDFLFSEKTENNTYYVLSREFFCIIEISAEKIPFLEWNLRMFIESDVIDMNIDTVKSITITDSTGREDVFEHSGLKQDLIVTGNGSVLETPKYRKFYMSLLYIEIKDSVETIPDDLPFIASIEFEKRNGDVYKYDFYFMSTLNAFFTVNGQGEFYVSRERILKILREVPMALANEDIVADAPE